jgi:cell division protein FtsQ
MAVPMAELHRHVKDPEFVAKLVAPNPQYLMHRRQVLRQRRMGHFALGFWRVAVTAGLLSGLVFLIQQPYWQLTRADQINIEGNEILTDEQIRQSLPLQLPLSLWQIQVEKLEKQMLQKEAALLNTVPSKGRGIQLDPSPFQSVLVERHLFPPRLTIHVKERKPIARSLVQGIPGFVDAEGIWLPLAPYPSLTKKLPSLVIVGWEYHSPQDWAYLLTIVQASGIPIQEINWQSRNALQLVTPIGRAHLGVLSHLLPDQLKALAQLQDLKKYCKCDPKDIDYIDLSSPKVPTLQLTPAATQERWGSPEVKQD